MRFVDPYFLYALILVVLPILIYFLQFRRYKTIYFSQVSLLKSIKKETKKKNDIKQLLILAARILAIAFLVLSFSRPYIPNISASLASGQQFVGIYVDNSFSMNRMEQTGSLLEQAKTAVIELANSSTPGTKFLLLTNQTDNTGLQLLNTEQLIHEVSQISESPDKMPISKAVQLLTNQMKKDRGETEKTIYLLSDFQQYTSNLSAAKPDPGIQIILLPYEAESCDNLMVDTCWFEEPVRKKGQTETLYVRVKNLSEQTYPDLTVRLSINDSLKALNTITLHPNETTDIQLKYRNNHQGIHQGKVEIEDYPILFDNTFYFSYLINPTADVLAISPRQDPAAQWMDKLMGHDENIHFSMMEENKIQLSKIKDYPCIFLLNLNELPASLVSSLKNFVNEGGTLCLFPGTEANILSYNKLLQELAIGKISQKDTGFQRMVTLNDQHILLRDVFIQKTEKPQLPYLTTSYKLQTQTKSAEIPIIKTSSGSPALAEYPFGLGRLYLFNFPLNQEVTDFHKQPLFVPVIYNMGIYSGIPQTIQYQITDDQVIELKKTPLLRIGQQITIENSISGLTSNLPLLTNQYDHVTINPSSFVRDAGFYPLYVNTDYFATLAFNYSRQESESPTYTDEELKEKTSEWSRTPLILKNAKIALQNGIAEMNQEKELWKFFLLLSLIFLLAETALIRYWK